MASRFCRQLLKKKYFVYFREIVRPWRKTVVPNSAVNQSRPFSQYFRRWKPFGLRFTAVKPIQFVGVASTSLAVTAFCISNNDNNSEFQLTILILLCFCIRIFMGILIDVTKQVTPCTICNV